MAIKKLLYKDSLEICSGISLVIPTLGQIIDHEEAYYSLVSLLTATPFDMMVQLDDMGIDFCKMEDYELFLLMFANLKTQDTSLIFKDLDLTGFVPSVNPQNGLMVLFHREKKLIIDKMIHWKIVEGIRQIHRLKRNNKKVGNEDAKKFLLKRARIKQERRKNQVEESQLESLIIAMVNTEQFHYDFEGVRRLTIHQFSESVQQVIKKVDYSNRMFGVYSGTVDAKTLSQDDLNWLTHK